MVNEVNISICPAKKIGVEREEEMEVSFIIPFSSTLDYNGNLHDNAIEVIKEYFGRDPISQIKKVIFNPPATVILFKNGEKVVVKTMKEDEFDPEIGFAVAMMKYLFGGRTTWKKFVEKWLPKEE